MACRSERRQRLTPALATTIVRSRRSCPPSLLRQTLNLGQNRVKDVGVEAMSCAALGHDYDDHRRWQARVRRQEHRARRRRKLAGGGGSGGVYPPGRGSSDDPLDARGESDLPPLRGTPLYAAASARTIAPATGKAAAGAVQVTLEGNAVSAAAVERQGALASLGEAALLRGCVLPEATATAVATPTAEALWG